MRKPLIWSVLAGLISILPFPGTLPESRCQSSTASAQAVEHNRRGLELFNTGFYELAPRQKAREADQHYELAAAEFKKAIAFDARNIAACRNLARVFYVQKKYPEAAEMYKKVTVLDPGDIDAYLAVADAYARLENYSDAIAQLEIAKTHTSDPAAIAKLNGFIERLKSRR